MDTLSAPMWQVRRLSETDSTSRHLRQLADAGAPHGTVVIADRQTAGHGRQGRSWLAPPGALLLSALLRPTVPMPLLSLAVGVAACEAVTVNALSSPGLALKWPNDLLIGADKCGGILIEGRWAGDRPEYLLIGIGVNVTAAPALSGTACLRDLGHVGDATDLAAAFLARLAAWLVPTVAAPERVIAAWSAYCPHWGQPLTVHPVSGTPWIGLARRLDPDGALVVTRDDGAEVRLQSGEVSLTPPGWRQPLAGGNPPAP
ncbi:MAG: biotin--[acetyl-CoA-carboxylase] ligase [Candidatus Sericytochromatia bacterium]|nr:biotin--[acetyl-CoA-carboxylase] ligase [Candidatus Sericytochromatia bacterium]